MTCFGVLTIQPLLFFGFFSHLTVSSTYPQALM